MIIREKIGVLFPNEPLNLIYQAPQESDRTQALARGMLFYRVRNEISKLISKKVIQPRRRRKVLDDSFESEEVDNPSTEIEGLVQILKRAREVTSEVERNWEKTAEFRLQKLNTAAKKEKQKGKGKKKDRENQPADTVQDYINDYKVLRHPQAHKLLELDFKHLYEEESGNLLSEWSNFLSKIEQLALNSRIEDQVGKELVSILKTDESDLDDNNKDALLLQILPSLCPPTARVTVGKKQHTNPALLSLVMPLYHTQLWELILNL
ncbi:uncharacterized protein LOC117649744 [Thrips palmi]|uniref:Uncharacterized protein LOC117649744 n=1 Tax=Thrips palmi TaxID=161013 RepID=A0A6P8ZTW5_THRPL|nr:uncharacterized protein LOC117649744 [Thrips palmi]